MHSYNADLAYGDASGSINTSVAEVLNINDDEDTTAVKTTHLKSSNKTHTYEPGFSEPGTITLKCNFTKAGYAAIVGLRRTSKWWKITDPDGSTFIGEGFVQRRGKDIPEDDRITSDITIKKSGQWAFTAAP